MLPQTHPQNQITCKSQLITVNCQLFNSGSFYLKHSRVHCFLFAKDFIIILVTAIAQ